MKPDGFEPSVNHVDVSSQPKKHQYFTGMKKIGALLSPSCGMSSLDYLINGVKWLKPSRVKSCVRDIRAGAGSEGWRTASELQPGFYEEHVKPVWAFARRRGRGGELRVHSRQWRAGTFWGHVLRERAGFVACGTISCLIIAVWDSKKRKPLIAGTGWMEMYICWYQYVNKFTLLSLLIRNCWFISLEHICCLLKLQFSFLS